MPSQETPVGERGSELEKSVRTTHRQGQQLEMIHPLHPTQGEGAEMLILPDLMGVGWVLFLGHGTGPSELCATRAKWVLVAR